MLVRVLSWFVVDPEFKTNHEITRTRTKQRRVLIFFVWRGKPATISKFRLPICRASSPCFLQSVCLADLAFLGDLAVKPGPEIPQNLDSSFPQAFLKG
jgi:hypothetical protein